MSVLLIILGLILFVALVVVHEFGHFIMARRNGVDVEEFGIGFPPMAWSRKLKSGLLFTLNWLPLGGFVRLKGEHDAATEKGSYGAASLWAKTKIIVAGVIVNLLVAVLMFSLLSLIGIPKLLENQFTVASDTKIVRQDVFVGRVEDESPAERGGLQARDKLISIKSTQGQGQSASISSANQLPDITRRFAGQKAIVVYERDGVSRTTEVDIRSSEEVEESRQTDNPKGYLGVEPAEFVLQRSTWSAPIVGLGLTKQVAQLTYQGLWNIVTNISQGNASEATQQVSGPLGVFVLIRDGSELGIQFILMIIAVISLTLAIMNSLPIPALDGGRLFVTYVYRLIRRPLTEKEEDMIHGIGFLVLLGLFALITIVDIGRFF